MGFLLPIFLQAPTPGPAEIDLIEKIDQNPFGLGAFLVIGWYLQKRSDKRRKEMIAEHDKELARLIDAHKSEKESYISQANSAVDRLESGLNKLESTINRLSDKLK